MYYFYCPNCGKEDEVKERPRGTVSNIRDGFGMPISHYECSNCHNLDAGFMRERTGDDDEKKYYQHVIGMYQNIRGFNKYTFKRQ
jgi:transposase-like protein